MASSTKCEQSVHLFALRLRKKSTLTLSSDQRQTSPFNLWPFVVQYGEIGNSSDLLFGLKLVKLPILPTLSIQFVYGCLRELRSRYLGFDVTLTSSISDTSCSPPFRLLQLFMRYFTS